MRSFGARADCDVWDEPFFAPFLKVTGKDHPGRAETLAAHETQPDKVAQDCSGAPPNGAPYYFQKHMPHHMLPEFPMDWAQKSRLFDRLSHMSGTTPPIVDCGDILRAPQAVLPKLCAAIDVPWDSAMLSWDAGPRETDGAWAPYWYGSVERSTGFTPPPQDLPDVPAAHRDIYEACMNDYDALAAGRLTA